MSKKRSVFRYSMFLFVLAMLLVVVLTVECEEKIMEGVV